MKRIQTYIFLVLTSVTVAACSSGQSSQASAELTKDFKGGPMPPDAQKKFQENMKKRQDLMGQRSQPSGKP
jgi:hypothetical protein